MREQDTQNKVKSVVGLALDIYGSELYWLEKTSSHPRQSALMIINVKNDTRQQHVDKFSLINQDAGGELVENFLFLYKNVLYCRLLVQEDFATLTNTWCG